MSVEKEHDVDVLMKYEIAQAIRTAPRCNKTRNTVMEKMRDVLLSTQGGKVMNALKHEIARRHNVSFNTTSNLELKVAFTMALNQFFTLSAEAQQAWSLKLIYVEYEPKLKINKGE